MREIWTYGNFKYDLDKTEQILNVNSLFIQSEESTDLFEVDEILDVRQFGSKYEFLVTWKGFSIDWATWENEDYIDLKKAREYLIGGSNREE